MECVADDDAHFLSSVNTPVPDVAALPDYNVDVVTRVHLVNARLTTIDEKILALLRLQSLTLRDNLIGPTVPDMSVLSHLTELDLYGNKIKSFHFGPMPVLQKLDVSFNAIRAIEGLDEGCFPALSELYLVNNKIKLIAGLDHLPVLTLLELGDNRIRKIENLEPVASTLKSLFLGKNKVTCIENLDLMASLEILSLQSNRLLKMERLNGLRNIRELYLSHNGISAIEGLESCLQLRILDLGNNQIDSIDGARHLVLLEDLWVNGNRIENLGPVDKLVQLSTIYLENNPLTKKSDYLATMLAAVPSLTQLDATYVKR